MIKRYEPCSKYYETGIGGYEDCEMVERADGAYITVEDARRIMVKAAQRLVDIDVEFIDPLFDELMEELN